MWKNLIYVHTNQIQAKLDFYRWNIRVIFYWVGFRQLFTNREDMDNSRKSSYFQSSVQIFSVIYTVLTSKGFWNGSALPHIFSFWVLAIICNGITIFRPTFHFFCSSDAIQTIWNAWIFLSPFNYNFLMPLYQTSRSY